MKTPLFLDDSLKISFEKEAMSIQLSDNVDNWQKEISSEIYKYLPYLADYAVNVVIQRASPERGYAMGSAQVSPLSDTPTPAGPNALIPIVVADRILKPLDVFILDGKAYPLNEQRIKESLFQGQTFETSTRKPTDQGMVDQMYPPIRTNYGYGAGVTTGAAAGGAGFGKFASLCEAISPTLSPKAVDGFVSKLANDGQLAAAIARNPAFSEAAASLVSGEQQSAEKTAEALLMGIKPTVVQFTKLASGNFNVKWANSEAFAPQSSDVGPADAQSMAGTEAIQGMEPGDSMTLGTNTADPAETGAAQEEIEGFGKYSVMVEETGQMAEGWVLPVVDYDGSPMPLLLYVDGESYSLQDSMVGTEVEGDPSELPAGEPQGKGTFVLEGEEGMTALPPLTVQNQSTDPEGNVCYMAETAFGESITICLVEGLQTVEGEAEGDTFYVPADAPFVPLGEAVHIKKSEEDVEAVKEARITPWRGWIRSTGTNEFHLDGNPFSKLANAQKQFLNKTAAEFLLVAAGLNQFQAREKLASAHSNQLVHVDGLTQIKPLSTVHAESVKVASEVLEAFPYDLVKDTVKVAATLDDSETADNILALNFLNPENISTFASYLPQLDETAQKLAEMLTATRFGLKQLDEGALERAMNNLEEVIQGLKAMQAKNLL